MPRHRDALPQLDGGLFVTDGGIETTLIFHDGFELPEFAAFPLLEAEDGREALRRYYGRYAAIARGLGTGLVLESPTWRASPGWGERLGYSAEALDDLNRRAIELMVEVRGEAGVDPVVISGCIGPEGDGYRPERLAADEAEAYHMTQIESFASTEADMVCGLTMTYPEEAIGIARAAADAGMPAAVSFTVETDGRLPTGQTLAEAVAQVEDATDGAPAYYMVNCAHPTHFGHALAAGEDWVSRIRGLRANASTLSHAELDGAAELDEGDPKELARQHAALRGALPALSVLGGCCGTDDRHVGEICRAWIAGG